MRYLKNILLWVTLQYSWRKASTHKPFVSDSCSGFMSSGYQLLTKTASYLRLLMIGEHCRWSTTKGKKLPWRDACVRHDHHYYEGGSWKDRWDADVKLMMDVIDQGYPFWGVVMFIAVRLGGTPFFPLPWRWGFGYNFFSLDK